jgi:hypothetical protein
MPDADSVKLERCEALTLEERKKLAPITPDFIIGLPSETDRLTPL